MPSDRRVQYTKKTIKNSLLALLHHTSIDQLTVKAICLEADINRATFYRHYKDIYDLLEEVEKELCSATSLSSASDLTNVRVLTVIYNNQEFYKNFFDANVLSSLLMHSKNDFYKHALKKATQDKNFDERTFKYSYKYFLYGIEKLLKDWLDNGCKETPEAFSEILKIIAASSPVLL